MMEGQDSKNKFENLKMAHSKIKLFRISFLLLIPVVPFILFQKTPEKKPNVIIILLDDYGYTDLGCYGSKFYETPNIDRLASEGIRFTDAYAACPVSSPTRAALMTGKYPVNTGVTDWIRLAPKGDFKERTIQSYSVYAAMIYSVDENLGKLFEKLRSLKIDKNTIIIFTSDNGGLSTAEGSPTSNFPLRAGKGWLYEGGIREPLIIKAPGFIKKLAVTDVPVSTIDFFPTILEMTGTDSKNIKTDGVSILPVLKSGKIKPRPLFWHYPHYSNQGGDPGSAIKLGDFKLIDNFETGRQELYNLKNDISEQNDLSETNPAKVNELYEMLKDWRNKTGAKMMDPNPKWNGL